MPIQMFVDTSDFIFHAICRHVKLRSKDDCFGWRSPSRLYMFPYHAAYSYVVAYLLRCNAYLFKTATIIREISVCIGGRAQVHNPIPAVSLPSFRNLMRHRRAISFRISFKSTADKFPPAALIVLSKSISV